MTQSNMPLLPLNCRFFKECAAPLCPAETELGQRLWFPGEQVCRRRKSPDWVQKQRQIARLKGIDQSNYFTVRMLNAIEEVSRGLVGADPAVDDAEAVWLREHHRVIHRRRVHKPEQGRLDI
jgi:hypothetical protein